MGCDILSDVIKALNIQAAIKKDNPIKGYIFEVENCIRFNKDYDEAPINIVFMAHSHEEAIVKIHTHLLTQGKFDYLGIQIKYFVETDEVFEVPYTINTDRFIQEMIFDPETRKYPESDIRWIKVMNIM